MWEPLLPDLILGRADNFDDLVGGSDHVEEAEGMGIPISLESLDVDDVRYLVANFRLFANSSTPTYRVVVAKKQDIPAEPDDTCA